MILMEHETWIKSISPDLSPTAAAKTAGLSHTTVLRQVEKGRLSADNVIAIARAYDASIVDALVDTGHIQAGEVEIVGVVQALGYATNAEMLDEMHKRVDPEAVRLFHGEDGEVTTHFDDEDADVLKFPSDDADTPEGVSGEQQEHEESTPDVHGEGHDLDEVLRKANQLKGAAQRRTPRLEEPEDP